MNKDELNDTRGMVFDIQHYAVHDGPGIRTIVFLKGCTMRCFWCENPEGVEQEPEIIYNPARCIGEYDCIDVCPEGAITKDPSSFKVEIDRGACSRCLECVNVCTPEAIRIVGRRMSASSVMEEVFSDRIFYRERGGITISGGEPLAQKDFTLALLKLSSLYHLSTALETNGNCTPGMFSEILGYVDHLLFDLKHMDEKIHRKYTGTGNSLVLQNLSTAVRRVPDITVRVPVVPGFNMNENNLLAIALYAEKVGVKKLHLLPYHNLGASKRELLGYVTPVKRKSSSNPDILEISPLGTEDILPFKRCIEEHTNLDVAIGG